MNDDHDALKPDQLREALAGFWAGALGIEPIRGGVAVAMPQTGADGWQLVLEITTPTPGMARLSDAGRTLGGLAAHGQNIESDAMEDHVRSILRQSRLEKEGPELFRWLPLPLDPLEVHVFAEALAAQLHA